MATVLDRRGGDRPRDAREVLCWRCRDVVDADAYEHHTPDEIEHADMICSECLVCRNCGEDYGLTPRDVRMGEWACRECQRDERDLDR